MMPTSRDRKHELDRMRSVPPATQLARMLTADGVAGVLTKTQARLHAHGDHALQMMLAGVVVWLNERATAADQAQRAIDRDGLVLPAAITDLIDALRMVPR
jgi:hypothetical protein